MDRVFWIVAVLGIGLVSYVQLSDARGPSKGLLVTGMSPQIEIIRDIASEEGWRIACEGTSGEMIALWVEPGFFADEDSEIDVRGKLSDLASTTSATKTAECSTKAPTGSIDHPTANPPLVLGDEKMLQPYLDLAKSCGFGDAVIAPIAEIDEANVPPQIPRDWLALYAGDGSANRYGPGVCMVKMTQRMQS